MVVVEYNVEFFFFTLSVSGEERKSCRCFSASSLVVQSRMYDRGKRKKEQILLERGGESNFTAPRNLSLPSFYGKRELTMYNARVSIFTIAVATKTKEN